MSLSPLQWFQHDIDLRCKSLWSVTQRCVRKLNILRHQCNLLPTAPGFDKHYCMDGKRCKIWHLFLQSVNCSLPVCLRIPLTIYNSNDIVWPSSLQPNFILVLGMLEYEAAKRFTIQEIKAHEWVKRIEFL